MSRKKGHSTQSLVNSFPGWSDIRNDEQSLGYQIFNSIGIQLDDLRRQAEKIYANWSLANSCLSDIGLYSSYQLPRSYTFTENTGDSDNIYPFIIPTVSGLVDEIYYNLSLATNNDIENFWYKAIPDRLSYDVDNQQTNTPFLIASGFVNQSPLQPLISSGLISVPNKLIVTISGGNSYFGVYESTKQVRKGVVQITGITREGVSRTEELLFLHDETQSTSNDYKEFTEAKVYGIENIDSAFLTIKTANFNSNDYSLAYELDNSKETKETIPMFYGLGTGTTGNVQTLDLRKYDVDEFDLRLDGWVNKSNILQQELLTSSGQGIYPLDLAVEPFSQNLWIVDSGNLYLYSADLPYPNTSVLSGKNYDAISVIEPNTYWAVLNDTVELTYIWRRPIKGLVKHRVWVEYPDGNKYSIEDGLEVAYHTDDSSWIFGEPIQRQIRAADQFVLTQRGDYIYSLECYYTDDTTEIDRRIVSVLYQEAKKEWALGSIGITNTLAGIAFDSEYKLWIRDIQNNWYQVNFHYDNMLIDFDKKIIYTRESYNQIRIY